jgi:HEAT repeat protein
VVEVMGKLGSRRVIPPLIDHLNDPDKSVAKVVLKVIEKITGKKMCEKFPKDDKARRRLIVRWHKWWKDELLG